MYTNEVSCAASLLQIAFPGASGCAQRRDWVAGDGVEPPHPLAQEHISNRAVLDSMSHSILVMGFLLVWEWIDKSLGLDDGL